MRNYPNIDTLLSLSQEIEDLKEAKELLWELFIAAEGNNVNWALRSKIQDYLNINEDE